LSKIDSETLFVCGAALKIHLSPQCKQLLDKLGTYKTENRGFVNVKVSDTSQQFILQTFRCVASSHLQTILYQQAKFIYGVYPCAVDWIQHIKSKN